MEVGFGDIIALGALGLSAYSLWRQRGYDEQAKHLNDLLIEREKTESLAARKGDLSANFVKAGKGSYQFKIYNRGKGPARNVRLEVIEGEELFDPHDLKEKLPYPSLEPQQGITLFASLHMRSARRATVNLDWDDDAGGGSKTVTDDAF